MEARIDDVGKVEDIREDDILMSLVSSQKVGFCDINGLTGGAKLLNGFAAEVRCVSIGKDIAVVVIA